MSDDPHRVELAEELAGLILQLLDSFMPSDEAGIYVSEDIADAILAHYRILAR